MAFIRIQLLNRIFVFYIKKITNTVGVNNKLKDGKYFLAFDFDDIDLDTLRLELWFVQKKYSLPTIYIANSGKPKSFHAYCLYRCDFIRMVQIALECPHIDYTFVRFILHRGHATLRIKEKNGRLIKLIDMIKSNVLETVSVNEFNSFTKYETGSL